MNSEVTDEFNSDNKDPVTYKTLVYEDVEMKESVLAMYRHIQNYVRTLISDIKNIKAMEAASVKEVASLANLLEQRECAVKVDLTGNPILINFPDVKSKLLVKISAAMEVQLEKLKELILPLKSLNTAANKARDEAINIIRSNLTDFDMCALNTGQPTIPPLAVMIGWIDKVEKQTREIYHIRMYHLENILGKQINSGNLVSLWSEDVPELLGTVKDCEKLTCLFVEESY